MAEENSKSRLGTGLSALLGGKREYLQEGSENPTTTQSSKMIRAVRVVPIESIETSELNPRKNFAKDELQELAASIQEKDIIQPILVRFVNKTETGIRYQIIAGERRWRAAQIAGLETVPVIEVNVNDMESAELALIENVQRTDLNAVEEAYGYKKLMQYREINANDLGPIVGKSRSYILNTVRLLNLPEKVQTLLIDGELTAGHARCLINLPNALEFAQYIVKNNLSVRKTEKLVQDYVENQKKNQEDNDAQDEGIQKTDSLPKTQTVQVEKIEKEISDSLGLKTKITIGKKGGKVVLSYSNFEQFEKLCEKLIKPI